MDDPAEYFGQDRLDGVLTRRERIVTPVLTLDVRNSMVEVESAYELCDVGSEQVGRKER